MPRLLQHNYCFQSLADRGGVRQLPDGALPANGRSRQAHRGVLLPAQRRLGTLLFLLCF
ncbi:hypothetical protein ZIOFF_019793 [Zingiber officinale]|uniref:Uncharacterized protein n=1 Tax=Zingiber officinale TaxID=94328 RepID=A0A8J5HSE4_ZINOF|nr:hypothetical protein ZIOFF_019793 [Zingiber officinale]